MDVLCSGCAGGERAVGGEARFSKPTSKKLVLCQPEQFRDHPDQNADPGRQDVAVERWDGLATGKADRDVFSGALCLESLAADGRKHADAGNAPRNSSQARVRCSY